VNRRHLEKRATVTLPELRLHSRTLHILLTPKTHLDHGNHTPKSSRLSEAALCRRSPWPWCRDSLVRLRRWRDRRADSYSYSPTSCPSPSPSSGFGLHGHLGTDRAGSRHARRSAVRGRKSPGRQELLELLTLPGCRRRRGMWWVQPIEGPHCPGRILHFLGACPSVTRQVSIKAPPGFRAALLFCDPGSFRS
jgi:hypothetical protein